MNNLHRHLSDKGKAILIWGAVLLAGLALVMLWMVPSRFGPVGW